MRNNNLTNLPESVMLRYLIALVPGIILLGAFYFMNAFNPNIFERVDLWILLRGFGRVSFFYLVLALSVTPVIALFKKDGFAPYRRVFWVLAFLVAIPHGAIYFYQEKLYHKAYIIPEHLKELDVFSGIVAFIIMAALAVTSNDFSVRLMKGAWKKLQSLVYPLFFIAVLHLAFASRFDAFYMVTIGLLVFLRTLAYLWEKDMPRGKISTKATRYRCVPCGWIYDEKYGDPDGGIAPGTRFEDIPDSWVCPVCGVGKNDFVPYEEEYEKENTPATVAAATLLNPTTLELVLETKEPFTVIPGQFARVALKDRDGVFYRSYSVVDSNDKKLTFCIKLSGGRGGNVLRNIKAGDILAIEGIYGSFVLKNTSNPKVFIATGTGLAPLMNMMRQLPKEDKTLLFWVQDSESLFYTELLKKIPKLESHIFLSREEVPGFRHGRVDISTFTFPKESEFYMCGNPAMVEKTVSDLKAQGFERIYHEIF